MHSQAVVPHRPPIAETTLEIVDLDSNNFSRCGAVYLASRTYEI